MYFTYQLKKCMIRTSKILQMINNFLIEINGIDIKNKDGVFKMGILNAGLAKSSLIKTSVGDNQIMSTRKKSDLSQAKVQYNTTPRDITLEQSFWDQGVMS